MSDEEHLNVVSRDFISLKVIELNDAGKLINSLSETLRPRLRIESLFRPQKITPLLRKLRGSVE